MKRKKIIIGYTTGVFDLFHIGHLNILKSAKQQCDHLIVGVSSDRLVEEYKKKLPVIPFEERFRIVEACRYVDEVIIQEDRDKYGAYLKYRFDLMFVGDDWKGQKLFVELEDRLSEHGVEIRYLGYTKTTSSTIIRELLVNRREEG